MDHKSEHEQHKHHEDEGPPTEHAHEEMSHEIHAEQAHEKVIHPKHEEGEHDEHEGMKHKGRDEHKGHEDHIDHTGHEQMFRKRFWICLLLSIPVLVFSPTLQDWLNFSPPVFSGSQWIAPIFSVIIFLYGGVPFLQMAVPEVRKRKPGMMTLISLAISVAFVYSLATLFLVEDMGFFWELVTLIDVMLLGHWLEMRSVRQASGSLDELAKLMPDTAERVLPSGRMEVVAVSELKEDDLILVRPGASVPADGVIEEGESSVNQAMITGESNPVDKDPGDEVIAGTINGDGSLRVRVTATGEDTALSGIMRLVADAQQSKSETQLLADKAAGWLFYTALAVAAITAVAWILATGFQVEVVKRVATVLVIACPHALGLAIPLVVAIGTSLAASNGVLVRNRLAMEEARNIDVVIFDKTGTLTKGEFGVVDIASADGWKDDDALALAAAIEGDSEHTIATGVRISAEEKGLSLPKVSDFEALKGRGVQAKHDGQVVYVGGPRLLEKLKIEAPEKLSEFVSRGNEKGHTLIYVVQEDQVVAGLALADVIRPESKQAVQKLHEMGIEVAMLTGDSEAVARAVAEELDIDQYFAGVLPEAKDQKVSELRQQGKLVAMVGDGVNDAPALTRADVGIAIGSGTDVAVESADVILVKNNPLDVVRVVKLSRASYRKMVQNLFWAAGYNIIALPLAAGVLAPIGFLLSPAVGALLMSLSTVIVAINAQLLRRADIMA
jgi:P-type Cu2+ transporter